MCVIQKRALFAKMGISIFPVVMVVGSAPTMIAIVKNVQEIHVISVGVDIIQKGLNAIHVPNNLEQDVLPALVVAIVQNVVQAIIYMMDIAHPVINTVKVV